MSDKQDAPVKPASTILMLRDGDSGLEVLMVKRHHQIDFASGAYVFPGGKVDDADGLTNPDEVRALCSNSDEFDDQELAFRVAAIREAFEESDLIFARKNGEIVNAETLDNMDADRDALNNRETTMVAIAQKHGLELGLDLLTPFAQWVTPNLMPKRFDTKFYLAADLIGQHAAHDGTEAVDTIWVNPNKAIEQADAGEVTIIFPTKMQLVKLGRSATVAEAMEAARNDTIVIVEPWTEKLDDGSAVLRIPVEAGYGDVMEPLSRIAGKK